MKHNKKASGKISRRCFAQTAVTSIIAAPLISAQQQNESSKRQTKAPRQQNKVAQPQKRELREHIPPFEISSGSVTIHTVYMDDVSDYTGPAGPGHGKHVINRGTQIKYVRVINTNGNILADFYGEKHPEAKGGQIRIWVNKPTNGDPNLVLKTVDAGTSRQLELEIVKPNHRFRGVTTVCSTGHRQHRRKCNDINASLLKVSICNSEGAEITPPITTTGEIEIDRIFIWTE